MPISRNFPIWCKLQTFATRENEDLCGEDFIFKENEIVKDSFIENDWSCTSIFILILRHFSLDLSGKNRITILKVCPKNCLAQLRSNIQIYIPSSCTYVIMGEMREGEKRLPQIFLGRTSIPLPPPKEFWKSSMGFSSLYEMLMGENVVRTCSKHGERSNCLREKWKFEHCKSSVPFGYHNS